MRRSLVHVNLGPAALLRFAFICFALICLACSAQAQSAPGASRSEIVIGTVLDLSGPMSAFGRQSRQGMQMRVDEINREGGVNGRMLRLFVEDSGSDPQRAGVAAKKLIEHDQVFALVGTLGAPAALVAMPLALKHNVINFLPIASGRAMYEPVDPLKVAFVMTTSEQLRIALPFMLARHHYLHPCTVSEEGDYANEIALGTEQGFGQLTHTATVRLDYAHNSSEFGPLMQRARAASCDLIVIGGAIRDAVAVINEAHRERLGADFLGTAALYSSLMHELGGRQVEGMYALNTVSQPYPDDASKLVRDWTAEYQQLYNDAPSVFAVYGWVIIDLFAKAATRAGPLLTAASFNSAMESTTFPRDMFGSPEFHISESDRLGFHKVRVSRIVDGRWVAISTLLDAPAS
jgi:branched-chain amino acid transport system substrate-binding protein